MDPKDQPPAGNGAPDVQPPAVPAPSQTINPTQPAPAQATPPVPDPPSSSATAAPGSAIPVTVKAPSSVPSEGMPQPAQQPQVNVPPKSHTSPPSVPVSAAPAATTTAQSTTEHVMPVSGSPIPGSAVAQQPAAAGKPSVDARTAPPAGPTGVASSANMPAAQPSVAGASHMPPRAKKPNRIKMLVIAVVALAVLAGGAFAAMMVLSGGGSSLGALVDDTHDGLSFKRPESWQKVEDDVSGFAYYTEEGKDINNVDIGMVMTNQGIGIDYDGLSEEQRTLIRQELTAQFSRESALSGTGDSCEEYGAYNTEDVVREGYALALQVDLECKKFNNRAIGGQLRMFIGVQGSDMHVFGVVADTDTWNDNLDAFEEIYNSLNTAQQ